MDWQSVLFPFHARIDVLLYPLDHVLTGASVNVILLLHVDIPQIYLFLHRVQHFISDQILLVCWLLLQPHQDLRWLVGVDAGLGGRELEREEGLCEGVE
jgi:hypothetical protein